MALNLSTLTSSATSGDVLAEALTTADFLEGVPVLRNLSRGSNKGGDAKQDVALNQPKALPLIDGDGYLYCSGVSGNYASVPDAAALDVTGDITFESDFIVSQFPVSSDKALISKYNTGNSQRAFVLQLKSSGRVQLVLSPNGSSSASDSSSMNFSSVLSARTRASVKVTWRQSDGRTQYFIKQNGSWSQVGTDQTTSVSAIHNSTQQVEIGSHSGGASSVAAELGVFSTKIYGSINDTNKVLDVDFTATNVRHGDTKFKCATGQVVTINQSGNDPATVIKKSVLRFDGVNDCFQGLFANNIDGGYMFAAFSVLGDGGGNWGRIFSVNSSSGGLDYTGLGAAFSIRNADSTTLFSYAQAGILSHVEMFDNARGDILHEVKIQNNAQLSTVNNAGLTTATQALTTNSDEFNIGRFAGEPVLAADLEYLAVFPATITDAQSDSVRNYINNRNNVFDLKDGFGYYFYDAQKAPVGAISSGSSAWNGRIVGSDNGDTDKLATQATANHQPVSDGFKVTFADNTDHLDIPSTSQAGWQVVGTSLGTFAYRVNANAVTELNLLGNAGLIRLIGDLYGIILLPESATGKDIEEARKLLIDRGASDAAGGSSFYGAWYERRDMVTFKNSSFPDTTNFAYSWENCVNLSNLETLHAPSGTSFVGAWRGTSALTSFPSGAKLGTSASSVNFTSAWQQSGLTSFPDLDLSNGNAFTNAWRDSSLTSFGSNTQLGTNSQNVDFVNAWFNTGLTSFPALDLSNGINFSAAWYSTPNLTSFPQDAKLGTSASNVNFTQAWRSSGLTSFSTPLPSGINFTGAWLNCSSLSSFSADVFNEWNPSSIANAIFDNAFVGCTALTAQSVENILTSIDASGKYGTATGAAGGGAINSGIDITYNVATGSLSAATNAAVTSLKSKGWSIIVNNVTL